MWIGVFAGDRVSGEGHLPCGHCRNCLSGRAHICAQTKGVGVNHPGAFADYLVTPEAKKVFAEANFEYPVIQEATRSEILRSWGGFKADKLNVSELSKYNAEAVRVMDRAGWR